MKGVSETIVLEVLNDQNEAYGYQLIQAIKKSSKNAFDFPEGTLYPLLYRLEEKKYIISKKKTAPSGKVRRYYYLTSQGKNILKQQILELKEMQKGLNNVLSYHI